MGRFCLIGCVEALWLRTCLSADWFLLVEKGGTQVGGERFTMGSEECSLGRRDALFADICAPTCSVSILSRTITATTESSGSGSGVAQAQKTHRANDDGLFTRLECRSTSSTQTLSMRCSESDQENGIFFKFSALQASSPGSLEHRLRWLLIWIFWEPVSH
ncbi:hypothetical protein C8F04DRAFT_1318908 [Mycena alexandri]|uniref:Secreted protein n=1 Tax=Mycena alexandri TaxID=1745969 RepID=A0AAD6T7V6_9AGAR|nr:hypothetical protein C8F04DRAFT_1318908 [Mycena alexandri]